MTFEQGDIVRFVGNQIAGKRSINFYLHWEPSFYSEGTIGIIENICPQREYENFYRCNVRIETFNMWHAVELMYDFEIEKI